MFQRHSMNVSEGSIRERLQRGLRRERTDKHPSKDWAITMTAVKTAHPNAAPQTGLRLQPWMHEMRPLVAAPAQLWCARDGSVEPGGISGFYVADTRVIDAIRLTVNGAVPEPVAYQTIDSGTSQRTLLSRNISSTTVDPAFRIDECRIIDPGGLRGELTLTNNLTQETDITLMIACHVDMTSMQSIKGGEGRSTLRSSQLRLEGHGDMVSIKTPKSRGHITAPNCSSIERADAQCRFIWHLRVSAKASVPIELDMRMTSPAMVVTAANTVCAWNRFVPAAADPRLNTWVVRSLHDLAGLRMSVPQRPDDEFLAAGAPWFFTLFGRDSLWAARFMLPVTRRVAMGTLRTLAYFQAHDFDEQTGAAPGKIPHELRAEPVVTSGAFTEHHMHLPPLYYGTIDATLLWVILLAQTARTGQKRDEIRRLMPNLEAALRWMVHSGDSDDDGFLEYIDTSGHGLANQGWKDSRDSVRWRDGRIAHGPIALCEVQGYAYQAAVLGAQLLDDYGEPGAQQYRQWAARLKRRFHERFWVDDGGGRYPAIALDGDKQPVDALTSNIGHLLGTGILDRRDARDVVRRLMSPAMFTGYGIRTLSCESEGYWPLSYHCGSVWAHDSAISLLGLHAEGYDREARLLADGLIRAAELFGYQMPELFSGDGLPNIPIPYPAACHPQAWSAASSIAVYSVLGGIDSRQLSR